MTSRPPAAPLIAVVGCDGAGKSTLVADLCATLGQGRRVSACYLGLGSGALGERIRRWPVVGALLARRLAAKTEAARRPGGRIPGPLTGLVIFGFSLLRRCRFARAQSLRRRGVAVLADRFPQLEAPGVADGPGLAAAAAGGGFVRWLSAREWALYRAMTARTPDLVLRLNVDAATALARKPEHRPELLARKAEITPGLRFGGAPIVDLDAREPYPLVRAQALAAAERVLDAWAKRG